jgi:hypothetical protein
LILDNSRIFLKSVPNRGSRVSEDRMHAILRSLLHGLLSSFRRRADLQVEVIALRHQLEVLQRGRRTQARLTRLDRTFWVLLYLSFLKTSSAAQTLAFPAEAG